MNLQSCEECGIVIDTKKVKLLHFDLPENPTEDERDEYGDLITEDYYINPDLIYDRDKGYLDTWKCPVCEHLNGIEE